MTALPETNSPTIVKPGLFGSLYRKMLDWAGHRHAERWLAAIAFAESSFFPVPPDTMLIPMTLAKPERALRYAMIATVFSVLGGLLGYTMGVYGGDIMQPLIAKLGWQHNFELVLTWFSRWGFWAVFVAGFSPIPYKLFTIGAGVLGLAVVPFAAASIIGRGARFFLEASLVARAGPAVAPVIERNMERVGWAMVALLIGLAAVVYLRA